MWSNYHKTNCRNTVYTSVSRSIQSLQQAYPESSQTSEMKLFAKLTNGQKLLAIFAKNFIIDVWLGSEC